MNDQGIENAGTRGKWSERFSSRPLFVSTAALFVSILGLPVTATAAERNKLGFVVESWYTGIYDTEYMEECPEGIVIGNDEIWFNGLSPEQKDIETGSGTLQVLDLPRRPNQYLRGPNGEDVCWHPESVIDPPMRTITGKYSFGLNLDGNTDGKATPNTCEHGNFQTPDGQVSGVDNQLYRLMGCVYGTGLKDTLSITPIVSVRTRVRESFSLISRMLMTRITMSRSRFRSIYQRHLFTLIHLGASFLTGATKSSRTGMVIASQERSWTVF